MCGLNSYRSALVRGLQSSMEGVGSYLRERVRSSGLSRLMLLGTPSVKFGLAAVAVLVLLAGNVQNAAAQTAFDTPAEYDFGVDVSTVFPIVVTVLSAVLLPMIVASLCLAVVYFIWSFAKGKAFGSA